MRILFSSADIWLLDLESKRLKKLTEHQGGDYRPAWSPPRSPRRSAATATFGRFAAACFPRTRATAAG